MTTVTIDLQLLNQYLSPDLGLVTLDPALTPGTQPPNLNPPSPTIMTSPALVPSSAYRWNYNDVRYLRLGYVLERDGNYESGEFNILSTATYMVSLNPSTYTPAPIFFEQNIIQDTDGSLGVTFSVMTDSLSVSNPQFGLAYQITDITLDVYPTLRVFIIKNLPLEV